MEDFEKLIKEHHALIMNHICYEKGCEELFGTTNILHVEDAIAAKGAEKILQETTWLFHCETGNGFDDWVKHKVKWDELPEYISKSAYLDGFRHQLTALFLKEKKEEEEANAKDVKK